MARRAYSSQFFAEDKDIYDVLASQRRGIPTRKLLQFARERGIFLSESEPREKLVHYIACLPFDWTLLSRLFELTETEDRAEKTTSSTLSTKATLEEVSTVAQVLKSERESERGEVYAIRQTPSGVVIEVQYTEIDESKTRLNQRRSRKLTIRAERTEQGLKFRHEANERADEIVAELAEELGEKLGAPALPRLIELSGVRDPAARTGFFFKLMECVGDYKLHEVSSVKVDRIPSAEGDSEREGVDEDEDLAKGRREATVEDLKMMGVVHHVFLKGKSLLDSTEYKELTGRGFFISHVVWTANEKKSGGCRVEFEAEFEDGPHARGFRYSVRGTYERKKDGELKKTRESVKESDKPFFMAALEEAAQKALTVVEAGLSAPLLPNSGPA